MKFPIAGGLIDAFLTRVHSHTVSLLNGRAFFLLTSSAVSPPLNHIPLHLPQPRSPSVTRTQTVEFAPPPQPRGRHQTKLSVDRSIKRQPSVAEDRMQPSDSNGEGHVEMASKSSCMAACRM